MNIISPFEHPSSEDSENSMMDVLSALTSIIELVHSERLNDASSQLKHLTDHFITANEAELSELFSFKCLELLFTFAGSSKNETSLHLLSFLSVFHDRYEDLQNFINSSPEHLRVFFSPFKFIDDSEMAGIYCEFMRVIRIRDRQSAELIVTLITDTMISADSLDTIQNIGSVLDVVVVQANELICECLYDFLQRYLFTTFSTILSSVCTRGRDDGPLSGGMFKLNYAACLLDNVTDSANLCTSKSILASNQSLSLSLLHTPQSSQKMLDKRKSIPGKTEYVSNPFLRQQLGDSAADSALDPLTYKVSNVETAERGNSDSSMDQLSSSCAHDESFEESHSTENSHMEHLPLTRLNPNVLFSQKRETSTRFFIHSRILFHLLPLCLKIACVTSSSFKKILSNPDRHQVGSPHGLTITSGARRLEGSFHPLACYADSRSEGDVNASKTSLRNATPGFHSLQLASAKCDAPQPHVSTNDLGNKDPDALDKRSPLLTVSPYDASSNNDQACYVGGMHRHQGLQAHTAFSADDIACKGMSQRHSALSELAHISGSKLRRKLAVDVSTQQRYFSLQYLDDVELLDSKTPEPAGSGNNSQMFEQLIARDVTIPLSINDAITAACDLVDTDSESSQPNTNRVVDLPKSIYNSADTSSSPTSRERIAPLLCPTLDATGSDTFFSLSSDAFSSCNHFCPVPLKSPSDVRSPVMDEIAYDNTPLLRDAIFQTSKTTKCKGFQDANSAEAKENHSTGTPEKTNGNIASERGSAADSKYKLMLPCGPNASEPITAEHSDSNACVYAADNDPPVGMSSPLSIKYGRDTLDMDFKEEALASLPATRPPLPIGSLDNGRCAPGISVLLCNSPSRGDPIRATAFSANRDAHPADNRAVAPCNGSDIIRKDTLPVQHTFQSPSSELVRNTNDPGAQDDNGDTNTTNVRTRSASCLLANNSTMFLYNAHLQPTDVDTSSFGDRDAAGTANAEGGISRAYSIPEKFALAIVDLMTRLRTVAIEGSRLSILHKSYIVEVIARISTVGKANSLTSIATLLVKSSLVHSLLRLGQRHKDASILHANIREIVTNCNDLLSEFLVPSEILEEELRSIAAKEEVNIYYTTLRASLSPSYQHFVDYLSCNGLYPIKHRTSFVSMLLAVIKDWVTVRNGIAWEYLSLFRNNGLEKLSGAVPDRSRSSQTDRSWFPRKGTSQFLSPIIESTGDEDSSYMPERSIQDPSLQSANSADCPRLGLRSSNIRNSRTSIIPLPGLRSVRLKADLYRFLSTFIVSNKVAKHLFTKKPTMPDSMKNDQVAVSLSLNAVFDAQPAHEAAKDSEKQPSSDPSLQLPLCALTEKHKASSFIRSARSAAGGSNALLGKELGSVTYDLFAPMSLFGSDTEDSQSNESDDANLSSTLYGDYVNDDLERGSCFLPGDEKLSHFL